MDIDNIFVNVNVAPETNKLDLSNTQIKNAVEQSTAFLYKRFIRFRANG